jgi:acetyltransferase-like isoleucine patch superfamily enzyme
LGSVTGRSLLPMTIYAGNPAQPIKERIITPSVQPQGADAEASVRDLAGSNP